MLRGVIPTYQRQIYAIICTTFLRVLIFFRLANHISEDSIGKVGSSDLLQRLHAQPALKDKCNLKNIGSILRKLFPSMTVSRGRTNGQKITIYNGVYWNVEKDADIIDWTDVYELLPRSCMLINPSLSDKITFAVQSKIVSNGLIVLKEVELHKALNIWKLKIRGKYINLEKCGINSRLLLTRQYVLNIIRIVEALDICSGQKIPNNDVTTNTSNSKVFIEQCSRIGDENSGHSVYRTKHCQQFTAWSSTCYICRRCQQCMLKESTKSSKINISSCGISDKVFDQSTCTVDTDTVTHSDNIKHNVTELDESIIVSEGVHGDLSTIFENVFPHAPEKMKLLLQSQAKALAAKTPTARRWNKEVISLCLSLWVRSPKAYQILQDSNMLILPSGRQLLRYKNCIPQDAGINQKVLYWMHESAKDAHVPEHGWAGGLHYDETKIQKDLVIDMSGGTPNLVGWIDLGEDAFNLKVLKQKDVKQTLAEEVMQLSFLGYTGFRFPVCHFPTDGIKASELSLIIWDTVAKLSDWGFQIDYFMQDGGQENRSFMNLHFDDDALKCSYGSPNLVNPTKQMYHTQDFSHNIKKLRNNIIKSGDIKGVHTRHIKLKGKSVIWKHWENAVEWDRHTNFRRLHYKVTESHIYPNISEKMRNELAETMLNDDMLNLMKSYRDSLSDGSFLNSTIEILEHTSSLINIFRDPLLIYSVSDLRFQKLHKTLEWLTQWRKEVSDDTTIPQGSKGRLLPSKQCLDDMQCMLVTFPDICKKHLQEFEGASIKPSRFNNDIAENIFCQQKGLYNGNNSNPTYYNYSKTVNSILLGQSLKSRGRKSNAGLQSVKPFSTATNEPICKKLKKMKS